MVTLDLCGTNPEHLEEELPTTIAAIDENGYYIVRQELGSVAPEEARQYRVNRLHPGSQSSFLMKASSSGFTTSAWVVHMP
jgi:hypothetical protein